MSTRRRWLTAIVIIIGVLLIACVAIAAFGVAWYVMSGGVDVPYPDGPPPTPTLRP